MCGSDRAQLYVLTGLPISLPTVRVFGPDYQREHLLKYTASRTQCLQLPWTLSVCVPDVLPVLCTVLEGAGAAQLRIIQPQAALRNSQRLERC